MSAADTLSKTAQRMLTTLGRYERYGEGSEEDGDYFDTSTAGGKRTLQALATKGLAVAWVDPTNQHRMFGALPAAPSDREVDQLYAQALACATFPPATDTEAALRDVIERAGTEPLTSIAVEIVFQTKYPLPQSAGRLAWALFDRFQPEGHQTYRVESERRVPVGADLIDVLLAAKSQVLRVTDDAKVVDWKKMMVKTT